MFQLISITILKVIPNKLNQLYQKQVFRNFHRFFLSYCRVTFSILRTHLSTDPQSIVRQTRATRNQIITNN